MTVEVGMEKGGYVYILGSRSNRLYVGVTSNLEGRVWQHMTKTFGGFTSRYNVDRLLHHEEFGEIELAISREKEIKGWRREKKLALIDSANPERTDMAAGWFDANDIQHVISTNRR